MSRSNIGGSPDSLARELENFQEIASYLKAGPVEIPRLKGFDLYGETLPLNGIVGGDHIVYVDFKQRYDLPARIEVALQNDKPEIAANLASCKRKAGIALVDVAGHRITDALLAAMFHQAFLLGSLYELDAYGEITERLFENLNTRFYNSSRVNKYLSMLYAEISEDARFRFLSAGHPAPLVFSNLNDRFMEICREDVASSPPLGTMPSKHVIDWSTTESVLGFKGHYDVNEWVVMGRGDIMMLATDGLLEHGVDDDPYVPTRLQEIVRRTKHRSAREIVEAILADLQAFRPPVDDVTLIAIKRN